MTLRLPPLASTYLADSSSLITLTSGKAPLLKVSRLTTLVKERRLRIPTSVLNEINKGEDRVKNWVELHRRDCELLHGENLRELPRIAKQHKDVLTTSIKAADSIVVAMAAYYREAYTVLTDDTGVQAALYREGVYFLPSKTFLKVEGFATN